MQGSLDGNERIICFSDFLLKSLFYQLLPVLSFSWSLRQTPAVGHCLTAQCWLLLPGLPVQLPSSASSPQTAVCVPLQVQVSLASSGP